MLEKPVLVAHQLAEVPNQRSALPNLVVYVVSPGQGAKVCPSWRGFSAEVTACPLHYLSCHSG